MTAAVISVVLEQLRSILQTEVNLLAGVRKESEKLTDTFTLIRGVLEDAEEKEVKNTAVKFRCLKNPLYVFQRYLKKDEDRNVQWIFLGCPGVGKGTYASRLSNLLGVPHIATGTSLVVTVIRSIGNDPGRVGVWCWSETGRTGKAVHFITFHAPLWGAILFNGLTYFQVIRMINNATRMAVGMSDRLHPSDTRADMKGLFNSIAYGLNSSVRRAIHERLDL
ncbi:hypothetical protein IFM89_028530 [Coptis chinensis]|uniref:Disease resistance N-terminal domain-containing protein n=1 Tax=Coptis chinensis TaxID=261450 RepID=A0A835IF91_9MAGN|nr:hypothetical protein IFM89_028530 [Coptis chinensis]